MKAALLPDRGVVKVAGDDARTFLNGLLTADIAKVTPESARFAALLTPQGKIIVDCIVAEAPAEDGGGFFLDCPRALAADFVQKLNFYKLRAKVIVRGPVRSRSACWRSGTAPATPNTAWSMPIRACRRSASASCCRRISPSEAAADLGARTGRRRRLRGAPHRARRAARRARFHLWRRLPARDRHGPARRRRFRQGLLCRPGGGVAHGASRHRAQPHRAGRRRRRSRPTPAFR